jgi:RimJ/RimL family protein N-acetyltransferase
VLENLGFLQQGLLRDYYIINVNAENEILYGLLKSDWEAAHTCSLNCRGSSPK